MEPTHNSFMGSSELPQPQEVGSAQIPESQPLSSPETQTLPPMPAPAAAPQQAMPMPQLSVAPTAAQVTPGMMTNQAGTQHLIADDADLIEKEWVTKAKAIVAQTKDDPYQQNQEMTKVKADYLKKRYNKDLKVSEG